MLALLRLTRRVVVSLGGSEAGKVSKLGGGLSKEAQLGGQTFTGLRLRHTALFRR